MCLSLFSIRLQPFRLATLLKRDFNTKYFPMNIAKTLIWRTYANGCFWCSWNKTWFRYSCLIEEDYYSSKTSVFFLPYKKSVKILKRIPEFPFSFNLKVYIVKCFGNIKKNVSFFKTMTKRLINLMCYL